MMTYPRYFVYLPARHPHYRPLFYTRVDKDGGYQTDVYQDREEIRHFNEASMDRLVEIMGDWREVKAEELVLVLGWI